MNSAILKVSHAESLISIMKLSPSRLAVKPSRGYLFTHEDFHPSVKSLIDLGSMSVVATESSLKIFLGEHMDEYTPSDTDVSIKVRVVQDGNFDNSIWVDEVPEEKVHLENPPEGFIVVAVLWEGRYLNKFIPSRKFLR